MINSNSNNGLMDLPPLRYPTTLLVVANMASPLHADCCSRSTESSLLCTWLCSVLNRAKLVFFERDGPTIVAVLSLLAHAHQVED